jgi:hypothetical protein
VKSTGAIGTMEGGNPGIVMSVLSTLTNIKLGGEKTLVGGSVIGGKPTKPMNSTTAPLTRPKEKSQHVIES